MLPSTILGNKEIVMVNTDFKHKQNKNKKWSGNHKRSLKYNNILEKYCMAILDWVVMEICSQQKSFK